MDDQHRPGQESLGAAFLTELSGTFVRKTISLPIGTTFLGRDRGSCDVVLDDKRIGRLIARIERSETDSYVEDTHGKAGIWVNGERVPAGGRKRLQPGDRIHICAYVFEYSESESEADEC